MSRGRWTFGIALASVLGASLLGGCAVGPNFKPPTPAVPATWLAPLPHDGQPAQLVAWWQQFNDPALTTFIDAAETLNPSLETALARLREARATAWLDVAGLLPDGSANAELKRSRSIFGFDSQGALTGISEVRRRSLDAQWELDLFGGKRRALEASRARARAREAEWNDAKVSLAAEVASTYSALRSCAARVLLQQTAQRSRGQTRDLLGLKARAGLASRVEAGLAEAAEADTATLVAATQGQCARTHNALVYLSGLESAKVAAILAMPRSDAALHPRVVRIDTLPAALIRQRPDVAAAEAEWAAANAEVGVGLAQLLPAVTLTGSLGKERTDVLGQSFEVSPWKFGPSISLPVLSAGRAVAGLQVLRVRVDGARAHYEDVVRQSIREVEDALVTLEAANSRADDATRAVHSYATVLAATEARQRQGLASVLELEELRRASLQADDVLLALEQERATAWIALYKALGGGWSRHEG